MSRYLTSTFSPAMLGHVPGKAPNPVASVFEYFPDQEDCREDLAELLGPNFTSAVGHEVTAKVLAALLGVPVQFNRTNLVLKAGDDVVCVIPNFRANEAREFSHEEVVAAGFRVFLLQVD